MYFNCHLYYSRVLNQIYRLLAHLQTPAHSTIPLHFERQNLINEIAFMFLCKNGCLKIWHEWINCYHTTTHYNLPVIFFVHEYWTLNLIKIFYLFIPSSWLLQKQHNLVIEIYFMCKRVKVGGPFFSDSKFWDQLKKFLCKNIKKCFWKPGGHEWIFKIKFY